MTTDKKLIAAAAALLDSGGEDAVTLRAVGHAVGVSHNAPYKHFKDRDALLAAVAIVDFAMLTGALNSIRQSTSKPTTKLKRALKAVVEYGHAHPARYRLIFVCRHRSGVSGQAGTARRIKHGSVGSALCLYAWPD